MTPREKALEKALEAMLRDAERGGGPMSARHAGLIQHARTALATPSDCWQPTALADPPGNAVIEVGDFVRMRHGGEFGPLYSTHDNDDRDADKYPFGFLEERWMRSGHWGTPNKEYSYDITHVRKAVK